MANPAATRHANHRKLLSLEIIIHTLSIGFVYLHFAAIQTEIPNFTYFFAGLSIASLVRVLTTHSTLKNDSSRIKNSENTNWLISLSTFALGIAWGALAINFVSFSPPRETSFLYLQITLFGVSLAVFTGSALSTQQLLKYIVMAFGIPIVWSLQTQQLDFALTGLFLLVIISILAMAANNIDELLERFAQVSRGNSELVRNLASTRDDAVKAKTRAEKANDLIKAESAERKKAEHRIKLSEMELNRILNDMKDTYFRIKIDGEIIRLSPSIETMLGFNADEALQMNWKDFFYTINDYLAFIDEAEKNSGMLQNHEVRLRHKNGDTVWASLNIHRHKELISGEDGYEGMARNTTDTRRAKEALFKEKELWRVALDSIADGIVTTDMDGNVKYLNPVAEEKTGWKKLDAYNKSVCDIMNIVDESSLEPIDLPIDKWLVDGKKAPIQDLAVLIQQGEKERTSIELIGSPIRDSRKRVIGSVMVFHDVTKLRALTKELSYQATHDKLTGLINRVEYDRLIEQAIETAEPDKQHALLFIDLDKFKIVNDTSGHPAGDELLIQITRLFGNSLREADSLARLGGDEFGVLLNGCSLEKAEEIAECLRKTTEDYRFSWEDKVFRIGASIGVVPITSNQIRMTDLLKAVDSACYVAKENGRNCVHVSHPDDEAIAIHHGQMQWMQRLQLALENDHFVVYAQPIKAIKDGLPEEKRAELLIRMIDTTSDVKGKLIQPSAFLPVAERYHLMPMIDQWILTTALEHMASGDNCLDNDTICSINLSGQSLSDIKIFHFIRSKFEETQVRPERICFEITESALIENMEVAREFLSGLREMGCKLALDDFGTGLSSFDYLKQLPVDFIKLDKVLISDIATSKVSQAMVYAINHVASIMGMQCIAEFVETDEIKEALCKLSIDYAQGFAIGQPIPFYTPTFNSDTDAAQESTENEIDFA
ncbi:MAG: EAL domain-containing protein [Methylococcaceae bacterium]